MKCKWIQSDITLVVVVVCFVVVCFVVVCFVVFTYLLIVVLCQSPLSLSVLQNRQTGSQQKFKKYIKKLICALEKYSQILQQKRLFKSKIEKREKRGFINYPTSI